MWWVLGIAVWAGLIAYLIITYRRKVGDRNRTRDVQFEQLMAEARAAKTTAAAPPAASAVVPSAPGAPTDPAPAGTAAPWVRKERLLDQPRALVYLLLRAGLPEHEVFANLTLADVVGTGAAGTGFEREQRVRRLTQIRTDFVVCTRRLEPVAVLALKSAGAADAAAAENARLMAECLTAAGVRYVSIDPAAPPRHAGLRALVLGG